MHVARFRGIRRRTVTCSCGWVRCDLRRRDARKQFAYHVRVARQIVEVDDPHTGRGIVVVDDGMTP